MQKPAPNGGINRPAPQSEEAGRDDEPADKKIPSQYSARGFYVYLRLFSLEEMKDFGAGFLLGKDGMAGVAIHGDRLP